MRLQKFVVTALRRTLTWCLALLMCVNSALANWNCLGGSWSSSRGCGSGVVISRPMSSDCWSGGLISSSCREDVLPQPVIHCGVWIPQTTVNCCVPQRMVSSSRSTWTNASCCSSGWIVSDVACEDRCGCGASGCQGCSGDQLVSHSTSTSATCCSCGSCVGCVCGWPTDCDTGAVATDDCCGVIHGVVTEDVVDGMVLESVDPHVPATVPAEVRPALPRADDPPHKFTNDELMPAAPPIPSQVPRVAPTPAERPVAPAAEQPMLPEQPRVAVPEADMDDELDDLFDGERDEPPLPPQPAEDSFDELDDVDGLFDEAPLRDEMPLDQDTIDLNDDNDDELDDLFGSLRIRNWKDDTGRYQTAGKLVSIQDGSIRIFKTNGRHCTVPFDRLSPADFEYVQLIASQMKPADHWKLVSTQR